MKYVKLVFGILIGGSSIKVMIETLMEDSGNALFGAFIGFLIIGGIAAWMISSALKDINKSKEN